MSKKGNDNEGYQEIIRVSKLVSIYLFLYMNMPLFLWRVHCGLHTCAFQVVFHPSNSQGQLVLLGFGCRPASCRTRNDTKHRTAMVLLSHLLPINIQCNTIIVELTPHCVFLCFRQPITQNTGVVPHSFQEEGWTLDIVGKSPPTKVKGQISINTLGRMIQSSIIKTITRVTRSRKFLSEHDDRGLAHLHDTHKQDFLCKDSA